MRHPILLLVALVTSLLVLLSGCSKKNDTLPDPMDEPVLATDRIVRVTASIRSAATRAVLEPKEESLDLAVRFTPEDVVSIYIRQGESLEALTPVRVSAVSADGKLCHFDFKVPEAIDVTKPATLIAVSGDDPAFVDKGRVYLRTRQIYSSKLSELHPPLAMVVRDCLLQDHPQMAATFEHLGFYTVSHIRNTGKYRLTNFWISLTDHDFKRPWISGSRAVRGKKGVYLLRFLDLETGELTYCENTGERTLEQLPTIDPGDEATLYAFEIAAPEACEQSLFRAIADYVDGDRMRLSTSNFLSHPGMTLSPGCAYHLYISTNGERMSFVAPSGDDLEREPVMTIDLGLLGEKPRLDLEASPVRWASLDLDGNGLIEPDNDEVIVPGANFFTPTQPVISFYGDIRQITLIRNKIHKVTLGEKSPIVDLDLRYNLMSGEALDELMRSLPTYKWATRPLLRIMGNPGTGDCHTELATGRGWAVDVPSIDQSQPHLTIFRDSYRYDTRKMIGVVLDAPERVRSQCWVDINNNGRRDEGEEVSKWGLSVIHDYMPLGGVLTLYGPFDKISFLGDQPIGEVYECTMTSLRMLEIPPIGTGVRIPYHLFTPLEYLKVGRTDWPRWSEQVDLSRYASLRYLIMTKSVVGSLTLPAAPSSLTHLDLTEADIWRVSALSDQTSLETLLLGRYSVGAITGRKSVRPQTLEHLSSLKRISVIGCNLYSESLGLLLSALPDRTGKEPGEIRLADNPGLGFVDLSIARRKNWTVDTGTTTTTGFVLPGMTGNDW